MTTHMYGRETAERLERDEVVAEVHRRMQAIREYIESQECAAAVKRYLHSERKAEEYLPPITPMVNQQQMSNLALMQQQGLIGRQTRHFDSIFGGIFS